jgi:hypothetical protein
MKGRYRFITQDASGKEVVSPWSKNLIMQGASNGTGLVARALISDPTFPLGITSGEIGTGSTAPTIGDTNLETPVLTGILIRSKVATATRVTLKLYITDAELANGTYREFALRSGTQLFARSLITPVFTKASGQNAMIEYQIDIS